MTQAPPRLLMFARVPAVGVKSRLAASIGPEAACQWYSAFVDDLVERMRQGPWHFELHLASWSDDYHAEVPRRAQVGAGLGDRMAAAFDTAFSEGCRAAVLIGSDVPYMQASRIRDAFAALESAEGVLGPTEDGGYDLIGLTRKADVFDGIEYSTPSVLQQTLSKPLRFVLLDTEFDVDTEADLLRLKDKADLLGPRTRALLA